MNDTPRTIDDGLRAAVNLLDAAYRKQSPRKNVDEAIDSITAVLSQRENPSPVGLHAGIGRVPPPLEYKAVLLGEAEPEVIEPLNAAFAEGWALLHTVAADRIAVLTREKHP